MPFLDVLTNIEFSTVPLWAAGYLGHAQRRCVPQCEGNYTELQFTAIGIGAGGDLWRSWRPVRFVASFLAGSGYLTWLLALAIP